MHRSIRSLALGCVVLLATFASVGSAHAATTLRRATVTSVDTVGGVDVVFNAAVVQVTPNAGVYTLNCEAIPLEPVEYTWAACWLHNLDTGVIYSPPDANSELAGIRANAAVLANGGRLEFCTRVDLRINWAIRYGPTRCQLVE